jgi:hypothetical protein
LFNYHQLIQRRIAMKTAITACVAVVLLVLSFPPETAFAQATVFSDNFESGKPSSKWGLYRRAEDTVVAVPMASAPAPLTGGGSYAGLLQDVDASYTGAAMPCRIFHAPGLFDRS